MEAVDPQASLRSVASRVEMNNRRHSEYYSRIPQEVTREVSCRTDLAWPRVVVRFVVQSCFIVTLRTSLFPSSNRIEM